MSKALAASTSGCGSLELPASQWVGVETASTVIGIIWIVKATAVVGVIRIVGIIWTTAIIGIVRIVRIIRIGVGKVKACRVVRVIRIIGCVDIVRTIAIWIVRIAVVTGVPDIRAAIIGTATTEESKT